MTDLVGRVEDGGEKRKWFSWSLNPRSLSLKRVIPAIIFGSYLTYGLHPLWYADSSIPKEQSNLRSDCELALVWFKQGENLGIDWDGIDWDKPNWGLSEQNYGLARDYLDNTRKVLKQISNNVNPNQNDIPFNTLDSKNPAKNRYVLETLARTSERNIKNGAYLTSEETLRNLTFPKSIVDAFNSRINLIRIGPEFYSSFFGKLFDLRREGEQRYGDCILLEQDDVFGLPKSKATLSHEVFEALPKFAQNEKIIERVYHEIVLSKFEFRNLLRCLDRKIKKTQDAKQRAVLTSKRFKIQESSPHLEKISIHDLSPQEIFLDYLSLKSVSPFNGRWEYKFHSSLDESTVKRLDIICEEELGKDWEKGWVKLRLEQIGATRDYDYNNIGFFLKRSLTLKGVGNRLAGLPAEIYSEKKIAYLDQSQKFGWWAEEKPYEAYPFLGLGVAALSAVVLYPLSRTPKLKERRTARDESRQDYQSFYRSQDKTSAR